MKIRVVFFAFLFLLFSYSRAFAAENPLNVANNKVGVHILFPEELPDAAKLVNANGGDWGYVTIPIQAGDKNLVKWQKFMDDARKFHIIPLIRLATEGDYFNTQVWRKPQLTDVLDFANFLNSLRWPTKNRYVIIFNEPNRANEWGGEVNPGEYAKTLSYAVSAFKSRDQNFFIISAGFDNAAPNQERLYMNEYTFMSAMNTSIPGIFDQVDGVASHSYPNPGFAQPPNVVTDESIASFAFEKTHMRNFSTRTLPIFITETGWSRQSVSDATIATYYQSAFSTVWTDPLIVAVTPFLLSASSGSFTQFSLLSNSQPTAIYNELLQMQKTKGNPAINAEVLAAEVKSTVQPKPLIFHNPAQNSEAAFLHSPALKTVLKWFLHL